MPNDTFIELGPKKNLLMPMGVIIAVIFFAISVTWVVAGKYNEITNVDRDLTVSVDGLTKNVGALTKNVDSLRQRIEQGENRTLRLEMQAETNP